MLDLNQGATAHHTHNQTMRTPVVLAAPHRAFFLAGLIMLNVGMATWLASRAGLLPRAISGLDHAFIISHGALAFFIFGFLLTVFPRWLDRPPIPRRWYAAASVTMILGTLALLAGLVLLRVLVLPGLVVIGAGWLIGFVALAGVLLRTEKTVLHAQAVLPALLLGFASLVAYALWHISGTWQWVFLANNLALWLFLAPIFLAVSHRMIPFFSHSALDNYQMYRPAALLWLLIVGCCVHFVLAMLHRHDWLWLADLPMAAIGLRLWWRWRPHRSRGIALLRSLFVAYAWFFIATLMFAAQSLWYQFDGNFVFGRAPVHALTIGFFTSMAIAMVTRVALGHSGRPLRMHRWQWLVLLAVQTSALVRIAAEWPGIETSTANTLISAGAWLWLAALVPWAAYFVWVCATARIDGEPG
jgi:uncharacterized protein involved in response to NO